VATRAAAPARKEEKRMVSEREPQRAKTKVGV
jgi:hypothetical protein